MCAKAYDPSVVEPKWQHEWEESGLYKVALREAKSPYFTHVMWPYPSGDKLHVGHWFNYGPADTWARYMRMRGKGVLSMMGFDAFGLPAENYAIKTGIHPATSTSENVNTMTRQLKQIGCMYDWSKTINSSEPEYYRWTQWLFLLLFNKGLAYRKEAMVNWDPVDQTVLANEQILPDGTAERSGAKVIQRPLTQWFFRTTAHADRLLAGLEHLDWPERTKSMQRHWIGRKEGINIHYPIEGAEDSVTCFTTRPDTNFGATFIVLAPEHPFVKKVMEEKVVPSSGPPHATEVKGYFEQALRKTELERQEEGRTKTGVFTGFYGVNRLNGKRLPIWVSDFVLGGYGTGAVVGVPGHDRRDFEFAQEYGLPIVRVVVASDEDTSPVQRIEQVQEEEGRMINSSFLDGLDIHAATERIKDHLEQQGWGERVVSYRLRDWLISRQRYWGAPIPIVYDPQGNPHAIPDEHLPWLLPTDVEFTPKGFSPLSQSKELVERTERIFGNGWRPELDTMDTFVCSSFYSYRYLAEGSRSTFVPRDVEEHWMPVAMYIGGAEHACGHLIYARFMSMVLHDAGFVSHQEPYQRLVHQGTITNRGAKMSKSRNNVVSPDSYVNEYGSDVFRLYLMFMGPFTEGGDWSDSGIKGLVRFVRRAYEFFSDSRKTASEGEEPAMERSLHRTIKKVTEDIERLHFNTAISALMTFLNQAESAGKVRVETAKTYVRLLAPFAPHLAEELWQVGLGGSRSVFDQAWPSYDGHLVIEDEIELPIMIDGKLRGRLKIPRTMAKEEIERAALATDCVGRFLVSGTQPKRVVIVPGKIVNITTH